MTEEMDKRDKMEQEDDAVEAEARPMDEAPDEELETVDIAHESEQIIRWGAARASVIVMTPFLGSLALMANECT